MQRFSLLSVSCQNRSDCGIFVMKNIELFSPRSSLLGLYSYVDIPKIRIKIANDMMFCTYNEMEEMKQAVVSFRPTVRLYTTVYFLHFIFTLSFLFSWFSRIIYTFLFCRFMENMQGEELR